MTTIWSYNAIKRTVPRANHECYPLQVNVNKHLIEYAKKFNVKLICTMMFTL